MKKFETPTLKGEKNKGLALLGYYQNLPERTSPKSDFIRELSERCGVHPTTIRNWIFFNTRPSNPEYIKIISEMTGIKECDLWGGSSQSNKQNEKPNDGSQSN